MTTVGCLEVERLMDEVRLYLAIVDVFRCEGCVPEWRPERPPLRARPRPPRRLPGFDSAH